MTSKTKMFSVLLAGTFLSSSALGAQTVTSYDSLLQALETANADVILNLNGGEIDLNGGTGLSVKNGQSVVFSNIDTWTDTSKNITNSGTIAIKNVKFDANSAVVASSSGGGVLYNQGGHITEISDSYFSNNTTTSAGVIWGGIIRNSNNGVIDLIKNVVFENNYIHAGSTGAPHGGMILNGYNVGTDEGYIKLIDGVKFINNSMTSDPNATGGAHGVAIDNNSGGIIDKITNSEFINNKTYRTGEEEKEGNYHASAGAIDNYSYIGEISNTLFQGNGAQTESVSANASSGAIMNLYVQEDVPGIIDKIINVQFIDNYAIAKNGYAYAGALTNGAGSEDGNGQIGVMENVLFKGNYVKSENGRAYAGALLNGGTIGNITGDFIGNYVLGNEETSVGQNFGGAIVNYGGEITSITGNFIGNYSKSANSVGGALLNSGTIGSITGNFTNNHNTSTVNNARGGAVFNAGTIKLSGLFDKNYNISQGNYAQGGAIYNQGTMDIENSSFTDNYAIGVDEQNDSGGAIWTKTDLTVTAKDGYNSVFSGNYVSSDNGVTKKYQAIYVSDGADLNLSSVTKGTITFDDSIDGADYNINVSGDGSGEVAFNNSVENVANLTLNNGSVLRLGLNGSIEAQNMLTAAAAGSSSPIITVDLEVDKAAQTVNSGAINISGDVSGDYQVVVNALNPDVLENQEDAIVPFLFAPNDDETTASGFSIARVIGSPYLWEGSVNAKGEETGSTWYLNLTDIVNPDYSVAFEYAPEVYAGIGLQSAAIEQTRSLTRNIRNQVASHKLYCPGCGVYDYGWKNYGNRNVWVMAQGESANIDKPVKIDAKIWGIEAGFDVQNDLNNTLGLFVSYRNGDYDLKTSDIDIDSYLAGLYYRYDRNMYWLFATVYGGAQKAEAQTDDKIAKFDTDGVQFGASVEAGRIIPLTNSLTLDPSLGISYTQVNFDEAEDNVGKEYSWKDVKHFEAELGAKLEKQIDYAKVYVKPSIIQTWTSGDSVKITGLDSIGTYKNQTLGRIELGGRYGFTDAFSVYGWVNYTFGSDYDATALGAGLNYAW